MKKVYILLAQGFEEVEALAPADLLRRAGAEVSLLSITDDLKVTGAHDICVTADAALAGTNLEQCDMLVLPGGSPGYINLGKSKNVTDAILFMLNSQRHVAAICAAPTILGQMGLLKEKTAVCFPGMESGLNCKNNPDRRVVTDGDITTAKSAGCAIEFGLELIRFLFGESKSDAIKNQIVF